jgi:outer membrane receptor protein involved in Fe transport
MINGIEGETFGVEIAANRQPLERWRLQGAYAYLKKIRFVINIGAGKKAGLKTSAQLLELATVVTDEY